MGELIADLRERAEFEDKRVLDEAKALGFVPEVYNGSQTGALLREAADALEAAREDAERWRAARRMLSDPMFTSDKFADAVCSRNAKAIDAAIDQARGIVPEAGQGVDGG